MPFLAQGGHGCISVTANVAPRLCAEMHDAWREAATSTTSMSHQDRLMPLHDALFCETSPAPVKYAAELLGRASAERDAGRRSARSPTRREGAGAHRAAGHAGLLNCRDRLSRVCPAAGAGLPARRRAWPPTCGPAHGPAPARPSRIAAQNRRARYDYFIEDTLEAGIMLTGTEVKSLRQGRASIPEAYAGDEGRRALPVQRLYPGIRGSDRFNHEPRRPRKLLVRKRELDRLIGAIARRA